MSIPHDRGADSDPPADRPDTLFEVSRTVFAMVPEWVDEAVTDGTAMRVYVRLARKYANASRVAWPSQQDLAAELGLAVRTVEDALRTLRRVGAIVARRSRRDDGKLGRNSYWLPMDHPRPPVDGEQSSDQGKRDVPPGGDQPRSPVDSPPTGDRGSGNQTHSGNQKTKTRHAAAADQPALPSMPEPVKSPGPRPDASPTVNQRATRLAQAHYERLGKMGNVPAWMKIIRKALEHGFTDERVDKVLEYIGQQRWTVTEERLANLLRGGPQSPRRPAPAARPAVRRVGNQLLQEG